MRACVRACVCVCVCETACACVCVCVCEREGGARRLNYMNKSIISANH